MWVIIPHGKGGEAVSEWVGLELSAQRIVRFLMYRRPPGGAGYGYGYGRRGRRADGSSLVSLLLFNLFRQLQQLEHKPPGLLLLLGLNVAVFFFGVPTTTRAVCIWPRVMVGIDLFALRSSLFALRSSHAQTQRSLAFVCQVGDPASFAFRSFAAAFTHADEVHLYYNMSSLIYKGYLLERWVSRIDRAPSDARAHSRFVRSFARLPGRIGTPH